MKNPVETAFRAGASLRGARIFHPQGQVFHGRWAIDAPSRYTAGATALQPGFASDALVRLSRGAGLPGPLPDIFGVAVHLVDVPQDVLVNSTIDAPLLHHLLLPSPGWFAASYTSSLPYRAGEGPRFLLGLLPPDEPDPGPSVEDVAARVQRGPLAWGIAVAALEGRWRRIGTLTLTGRAPEQDELRFDPWRTSEGLRPAGVLNALRKAAYRGSRRGAPGAR